NKLRHRSAAVPAAACPTQIWLGIVRCFCFSRALRPEQPRSVRKFKKPALTKRRGEPSLSQSATKENQCRGARMKNLLAIISLLGAAVSGFAQGTIRFSNDSSDLASPPDRLVRFDATASCINPAYVAG